MIAPSRQQIEELIAFARAWGGKQGLLVHCRAGSSRSPAAAMICLASIGRIDQVGAAIASKAYFRPHAGCLRLADTIMSPSLGLLAIALSKPAPVRLDDVGPVSVSLGG